MTKEQAIEHIKTSCYLVGYPSHDKEYETRKCINEALDMAIKALEQPTIDKPMIDTLIEENEKLKADNKILAENCLKDLINCHLPIIKEQQPCDDCVSRKAILDLINADWKYEGLELSVRALLPVTPTRKVGKWIYNKAIQNWQCSECNETPKTLGYCGTSAFMTEHFKFCNHCGAKMRGAEND